MQILTITVTHPICVVPRKTAVSPLVDGLGIAFDSGGLFFCKFEETRTTSMFRLAFIFFFLFSVLSSRLPDDEQSKLRTALEVVAGVYHDIDKVRAMGLEKTVLLTAS